MDVVLCQEISLVCDYTLLGKVQNLIAGNENIIKDEPIYADRVNIPIKVPVGDVERFCANVTDKMNAQVKIIMGDTEYFGRERK